MSNNGPLWLHFYDFLLILTEKKYDSTSLGILDHLDHYN